MARFKLTLEYESTRYSVWQIQLHALNLTSELARRMRDTAARLTGMRDFRSFTDDSADEKSTVVAIERIEIAEDGDLILVRVEGSHFLWKMVRRMVGVMVEAGRGGITPEQAETFLR